MADILKLYFDELKPFKATNEENLILYHKWKSGDTRAYDRLVRNFLPLVIKIAKKYGSSSSSLQDLISEGNINLLIGINKFEESKGALASYLVLWIEAGIIKYLKKPEYFTRLDDEDTKELISDQIEDKEDSILKSNIFLDTLSRQDRSILELAFGIGHKQQYDVNEIADILCISSVTVRNKFKSITGITISSIIEKEMNFETCDKHANTIQLWLDDHLEYQDRVTYEVVSRGTNLHLSVIKKSVTEDQKLRIKKHNRLLSSL